MAAPLRFDKLLETLTDHQVCFIVVGGVAAILRGAPLTTRDLDIVYLLTPDNIERLAGALATLSARYVDPAGRLIVPGVQRLESMRVHLLHTTKGRLDVQFVENGQAERSPLSNPSANMQSPGPVSRIIPKSRS